MVLVNNNYSDHRPILKVKAVNRNLTWNLNGKQLNDLHLLLYFYQF